jgi:hypothetical protein
MNVTGADGDMKSPNIFYVIKKKSSYCHMLDLGLLRNVNDDFR